MPSEGVRRPAVFWDRDGTLMEEVNYCARPEDVHIFPEAQAALRKVREAGFLNIIITNQAGIGRGIFTEADYRRVEAELLRQLGPDLVDATYFCPDHPDHATARRKPGTGMIDEAVREFQIDLERSFFVGDKAIDVECGQRAGMRSVLVETGYGKEEKCEPDFRAKDLGVAIEWMLGND